MTIMMIKKDGKMMPARKNDKGEWEPIEDAKLVMNTEGELEIKKSEIKKDEEKK